MSAYTGKVCSHAKLQQSHRDGGSTGNSFWIVHMGSPCRNLQRLAVSVDDDYSLLTKVKLKQMNLEKKLSFATISIPKKLAEHRNRLESSLVYCEG